MADLDVAAAGGDLGELFEYKLKQPVTIRRNQSAMVPVVQHDVAVERVSLWSAARGVAQPLRAVWLTNDTGLTLDGGSLTLVEGGAFAGEGLVEAIKPGEKRFVSYAVDLGVRVTAAPQDSRPPRQPYPHRVQRDDPVRRGARRGALHDPQRRRDAA